MEQRASLLASSPMHNVHEQVLLAFGLAIPHEVMIGVVVEGNLLDLMFIGDMLQKTRS